MEHDSTNPKFSTLLREVDAKEQSSAKMAWFGPQGAGKTMSATQVAIGLSLCYHQGAPIAFFDTEKGSNFAKPLCDAEGIKLLGVKSRAFADLLTTLTEAEQQGACCLIVDSMTHVWTELMDAFCRRKKISRIEFQHWRELKATWREWVDRMLNSSLHILIAGRAGKEYEYQENEAGKKELITTGTKFKAEGDFGYEPDILVELWNEREEGSKRGSHLVHKGIVLKDRSWAINGREFSWKDKSTYKKGDYRNVYKCFEPYFQVLSIGKEQVAIAADRTSDDLFDANGDSRSEYFRKLRMSLLEDWDATMDIVFPGSTAVMKTNRALAGEAITGERSRTRIEQFDLRTLENCVKVLRTLEERLKAEPCATKEDLLAQVEMAKEEVRAGSGAGKTLLEVRLGQSVKKANGKGPQPIVAVAEAQPDEVAGD